MPHNNDFYFVQYKGETKQKVLKFKRVYSLRCHGIVWIILWDKQSFLKTSLCKILANMERNFQYFALYIYIYIYSFIYLLAHADTLVKECSLSTWKTEVEYWS